MKGPSHTLFILAIVTFLSPVSSFSQPSTPNVLLILTDDQRYDTFDRLYMPHTLALIADEGIVFDRAYVTTSLCGPSRASLLTGKYSGSHQMRRNGQELNETTFVDYLHRAGYYTGLVGKYLNSWDGRARSEFDFWVSFEGGFTDYNSPRLNVNGAWQKVEGYTTDLFLNYAVEFLVRSPRERPFFLLFAPNAPHHPSDPPLRDSRLYTEITQYRPPSFNEEDVSDKPAWLQKLPLLKKDEIERNDSFRLNQLRALKSVDEAVANLLILLKQSGQLDRTVVLFLSDNGVFWGEHRLVESKNRVYEPAVRVPFAIRYPPVVSRRTENRLVANIDIAPTIYELAGIPAPEGVEGRSLVPLFSGGETAEAWRDVLFLEGRPEPPFDAVHNGRYVYVETYEDKDELYDLEADPNEITNVARAPEYGDVARAMRQRLRQGKD